MPGGHWAETELKRLKRAICHFSTQWICCSRQRSCFQITPSWSPTQCFLLAKTIVLSCQITMHTSVVLVTFQNPQLSQDSSESCCASKSFSSIISPRRRWGTHQMPLSASKHLIKKTWLRAVGAIEVCSEFSLSQQPDNPMLVPVAEYFGACVKFQTCLLTKVAFKLFVEKAPWPFALSSWRELTSYSARTSKSEWKPNPSRCMKTFEHYQYLSIRTDPVFTDLGHVGAAEDWALTSWPSIILAVQEDSQIKGV